MAVRPFSLAIVLFLFPVIASGQSYEWFEYSHTSAGLGSNTDLFEVDASDHGTYSVGRADCDYPQCFGLLLKYGNDDGQLEWRRRFTVFETTEPFTLAVNGAGIFVGGRTSGASEAAGFVRLYSHDGDTIWTKRDPNKMFDTWDMVTDAESVFVAGSHREFRAMVRRISNGGEYLWTRVMSDTSGSAWHIELVDGRLYVLADDQEIKIIRASDGAWIGSFPVTIQIQPVSLSYHDGFLYVIDYLNLIKYSLEGEEIWRHTFRPDTGPSNLSGMVASQNGIFVSAAYNRPFDAAQLETGTALVRVGPDGTILDVMEYPADTTYRQYLAYHDGALYGTGGVGISSAYTARYSEKDLIGSSVLSLAGATPAMPPRLAVLGHDLGAGPVRVSIRDAAPGSIEYMTEFSEGLKPIGFDKAPDLNGNGYEELVVVSRLPAVAEVRDSVDGNVVASISLGNNFEPVAATVEERAGTAPRLAVAVRNKHKDTSLVRVYNLQNGNLISSNAYHPDFDAVDLAALPAPSGSDARRYALLARNRLAGEPHKIEVRAGNGSLLENLWLGSEQDPLQLAAGEGVDGLAALRYGVSSDALDVVRIELATGDRQTVRFGNMFAPVAMLELPDGNGNGSPEYTVYGAETDGYSVKAETRDVATGALAHNVFTGKFYRPQDAAWVGAIPGFSDNAFALLGFREAWGECRVSLADADGTKLFDLTFFSAQ